MNWQDYSFAELSNKQLYLLLKHRVNVFVVEQNCPYPELDDKDDLATTRHLIGTDEQGNILAYARILAPHVSYEEASIGRVLVVKQARGQGVASQLMSRAIDVAGRYWPETNIQIGAQAYLEAFYQQQGFETVSDIYLEDNIPHLDMLLCKTDLR